MSSAKTKILTVFRQEGPEIDTIPGTKSNRDEGGTKRAPRDLRGEPARLRLPAILLAVAVLFTGCAAGMSDVNLGPLYYVKHHRSAGVTETEVLWPLLHVEERPAERHVGLRPLFYTVTGRDGDFFEMRILWPFVQYRRDGENRKLRLFPIFTYTSRVNVNGERDVDASVFPVLFWGSDPTEGSYFAFFPVIGRLKGILGKDELRFFLFPLYSDSRDGEHRAWNVLYPVFHRSRGGGREGWRVWPLWSVKERAGKSRTTYTLWPLVSWGEQIRRDRPPLKRFTFLPFYGFQETGTGRIDYFLFPFFSRQAEVRDGVPYRELSAPWPLFTLGRGWKTFKWYSWPLFGVKAAPGVRKGFALYPIFWYREDTGKYRRTVRRWALPLYWSTDEVWPEEGLSASKTRVFPLLDHRRSKEGRSRLSLLAPLWFRDRWGIDRSYGVFWTLYEQGTGGADPPWRRVLWQYFGERGESDYRFDFEEGMGLGPAPLDAVLDGAAEAASRITGGEPGDPGLEEQGDNR